MDVAWHHPAVLRAVFGFERRVARKDALDAHLTTFAVLASAATIGCSWCLDFGYSLAHIDGLDLAEVSEVPRWRDPDVVDDLERDVMAYAETMSATPCRSGSWVGHAVTATDELTQHRDLLFTIADEMLSSAADAEDVLQETVLRWSTAPHCTTTSSPPAPISCG